MIGFRDPVPSGAGSDLLARAQSLSAVACGVPRPSRLGFTLTTRMAGPGFKTRQVQYATDLYVVTRVDGMAVVYLRDRDERFVVRPGSRTLQRIDVGPDSTLPAAVSACLASAIVEWSPEPITLAGRTCRSGIVRIEEPSHLIEAEITVARVSGLEKTALGAEYVHTARSQLVRLHLAQDECIASLRTRVLARGCHHRQAVELLSVEPVIDQRGLLDAVQQFSIVE